LRAEDKRWGKLRKQILPHAVGLRAAEGDHDRKDVCPKSIYRNFLETIPIPWSLNN